MLWMTTLSELKWMNNNGGNITAVISLSVVFKNLRSQVSSVQKLKYKGANNS